VPLQSGSDDILRAMRRRYRTPLYRSRAERIKELMPHACIGVDVITGFPGETEEKFAETHNFLLSLPVSYLHVFTYSERDNTTAMRMEEVVPMEVRNERTKILRMLSDKMKRAFYNEHLNTQRNVLWEANEEDGYMHGFTDNYIKVRTKHDSGLVNNITTSDIASYTIMLS
jgi:threonylcarbamoyladenosine tRNA methylthiotransferase MtaB